MSPGASPGVAAGWRRALLREQVELLGNLLFVQPFRAATKGATYRRMLWHRLGAYPPPRSRHALWLHTPGMGEFLVGAALTRALPPELPVVVTTFYSRGGKLALGRGLFPDHVELTYLPLNFRFAARRFCRLVAPRALVHVEAKPWSLVTRRLAGADIPAYVINVFIGERHQQVLSAPLIRPLLADVEGFGAQGEEERRQLIALGVPDQRILVTGSLKFDVPAPVAKPELDTAVRALAAERPVLVAGSAHLPEVEPLIDAFEHLGGGLRALLVVAPRHPAWSGEMEQPIIRRGHRVLRRSRLRPGADGHADVLLLDTEGELAALYATATAAFVGGSLFPWGGHNPLEAARFSVPVAVGPSTEHLQAIAEPFDRAAAWQRVADGRELGVAWKRWLDDPPAGRVLGERGAALLARHRGALDRTLEMLAPVIGG